MEQKKKRIAWNKGLTKEDHPGIALVAKKKSKWWKTGKHISTRKKIGESSKKRVFKRGSESTGWKGGRYVQKRDGYVYIYRPEHPNAKFSSTGGGGYVLEHRLVMEKKLGRYLLKGEDVHHRNGKKDDNRIKNLMLVVHTKHYEEHGCPKCGFKINIK